MARKYYLTMKTPDVLDSIIEDAAKEAKEAYIDKRLDDRDVIDDDELEGRMLDAREEVLELTKKWFNHGESVTLVIDLDAKTCTVLEK